jgi:hypothetical protein
LLQHGAFTHCVACGPTGGELLHAQNHLINFVEQVIDEVELGDGPIAVRSKLDNVKITIFLNPHDLVGKIFDEITDMFGTGIIMTRGGRLLELHKSETVFAFGLCNEDWIVLAHRGRGGGKRARARSSLDGEDRDDVIDAIKKKLQDDVRRIGAVDAVPPLQVAVDYMNDLVRDVSANRDAFKLVVRNLQRDCLNKIQTVLETKNGDQKVINLTKIVAREIIKTLNEVEAKKKDLEVAMFSSTLYAVTAAFADDSGRLEWKSLQDFVKAEISARDVAKGFEQAVRQADRDMRD